MNKFGLALSGGGFRASLYHLGLVRFLRDAGVLSQVSHITSVSGGSVLAAHLVLNWDRYNGSPNEFDAAASELLAFVRLDVRNRITRRFPLNLPLRPCRRLLGLSNRKLTRTGLLEYHYEKFLYGDTSLFQLPEKPKLHILTTNLSEGCLCSFSREGLLMMRRETRNTFRMDRVHVGLATVPMAVTASSAFPGFFPPLELTGTEVGASKGEFGRQAFTDGGVFDNLAVRMFRFLERPMLVDSPLVVDDFVDFANVLSALRRASSTAEKTPLGRLAEILRSTSSDELGTRIDGSQLAGSEPSSAASAGMFDREERVVSSLAGVLRHYPLCHEPLFAGLRPDDPDAEAMLRAASRQGIRAFDPHDLVWLNRHLVEAAYRQATGGPCFWRLNSGLDGVIVSDVGKPIAVKSNARAGGLIRTALRATEILMDRVWQLENETFQDTPGFVFAPITEVVERTDDPTALNAESQRQAVNIRTDLDRFSAVEISSLVRHGYCVARKALRSRPELFGRELPNNPPWDPVAPPRGATSAADPATLTRQSKEPSDETVEARTLQASASRRIWGTLLSFRDWVSYLYIPVLAPVVVLLPYLVVEYYETTHRTNKLIQTLSQGVKDLERMGLLLESPIEPWNGVAAEEVRTLDEPDLSGFEILQDSRILDMRHWDASVAGTRDSQSFVYMFMRLRIVRRPGHAGNSLFRTRLLPVSPEAQVRFPQQLLEPKLRRSASEDAGGGEKTCVWEVSADLLKVPVGESVDLLVEVLSPGRFLKRGANSTTLVFDVQAETAEVLRWVLLPEDRGYQSYRILRYPKDKPEDIETVRVVTEFLADDSTILAYKLLSVESGYRYEVTWYYK